MAKNDFKRTTITVEVLSNGENLAEWSLSDIIENMDAGDLVGKWEITDDESLDGSEMAEALVEFGSEPNFFNLDEDGNDLDDEDEDDEY